MFNNLYTIKYLPERLHSSIHRLPIFKLLTEDPPEETPLKLAPDQDELESEYSTNEDINLSFISDGLLWIFPLSSIIYL